MGEYRKIKDADEFRAVLSEAIRLTIEGGMEAQEAMAVAKLADKFLKMLMLEIMKDKSKQLDHFS